ncbi:MAG TPA: hypothetical protein VIF81_06520 [Pyrinomonadaceae bacterium]|jgi:hypothetical protein
MAVQTNVIAEQPNVSIDVTGGEHLQYKLTPRGARPVFQLVDTRLDPPNGRVLMSANSAPASNNPLTFVRKWPVPNDTVNSTTNHTMGLQFLAAIQYRYEVGVFDSNDKLLRTVIDITYTATAADQTFFQSLNVNAS